MRLDLELAANVGSEIDGDRAARADFLFDVVTVDMDLIRGIAGHGEVNLIPGLHLNAPAWIGTDRPVGNRDIDAGDGRAGGA